MVDTAWTSADLAKAVCDSLVATGRLKATPAFIRNDREAKIAKVFAVGGLDGATMAPMNGREIEVAVRNATQGEAWVDDVQGALKGMLTPEAAAATKIAESEDVKALREKMVAQARVDFSDGAPPPNPAGPGGGRRGGGDRDQEAYGSFGGGDRGGGRECYNCGQIGHLSRDCPEPRKDSFGGGDRGGRGGDSECYNCGQIGHLSRDCPEPRKDRY